MNRDQVPKLLDPGVRAIFFDEYEAYPEEYSQVFTVDSTVRRTEEYSEISSFAQAPAKDEGDEFESDRFYAGYNNSLTPATYGLKASVTLELIEDDLFKIINQIPSAAAIAQRETQEAIAANILNNAYSTTYGDGVCMISDSHPYFTGIGGTWSNVLATPADLTLTSLKAAVTMLRKMKDERGKYIRLVPESLIIPPDLEFDAYEILKSMNIAGSQLNNKNPFGEGGLYSLQTKILTRLTDTDGWFLQAKPAKKGRSLVYLKRIAPDFKSQNLEGTGDVEYNSRQRFAAGLVRAPRDIVGTPGV